MDHLAHTTLESVRDALDKALESLRDAFDRFVADDCMDLAAVLAFYSLFSLAPMLVVLAQVVGLVLAPARAEQVLIEQLGFLVGTEAATTQARAIVESFREATASGGGAATLLALGVALFGATTVVVQLQSSLNRVWGVERRGSVVRAMVTKRLGSLALLGVVAFLLTASVLATSTFQLVRSMATSTLPELVAGPAVRLGDISASWLVFSGLFAVLFRYVPDAVTSWRALLPGAAATGAMFLVGKEAIAWYLGSGATGSLYGAAGSLAALLTWVFYSSLILLYGAELTLIIAEHQGRPPRPRKRAAQPAT